MSSHVELSWGVHLVRTTQSCGSRSLSLRRGFSYSNNCLDCGTWRRDNAFEAARRRKRQAEVVDAALDEAGEGKKNHMAQFFFNRTSEILASQELKFWPIYPLGKI